MAGRSNTELKVFLNGSLTNYQNFCQNETDKQGSVFFDKKNHAIYVEGNRVVGTQVEDVVWDNDKKTLGIYPISGSPIIVELGVEDDLNTLKTTLESWAGDRFVRYDVNSQGLTETQKTNARTNIGAEKADSTILKQSNVVNNVTSESTNTPLSAKQGKVLKGLIDNLSDNKVDKVSGKQLSTEDFTTALKTKLVGLNNYDDTVLSGKITELTNRLNTLIGSKADANKVIDTFNEIVAFLEGIEEGTLESILSGISGKISALEGKDTTHEQRMTTIEGNVTTVTDKANENAEDIKDLEGRVGAVEETAKNGLVSSVNGQKGDVVIAGKEYVLDIEGYHKAHPIWVTVADNKEVVVDADPVDILALALKTIAGSSDSRVVLRGVDIKEDFSEENYSIVVDAHAKVWEL